MLVKKNKDLHIRYCLLRVQFFQMLNNECIPQLLVLRVFKYVCVWICNDDDHIRSIPLGVSLLVLS